MSDDIHKFSGKEVDVLWDRRLCIHVSECGRASGDLFVGGRKPWCQPDRVQLGEVHEVVERCPTGAITYIDKDGART
ncbi:MAG: (4Fe-4S)-binding protein, partial [Myxococcota bacterium]